MFSWLPYDSAYAGVVHNYRMNLNTKIFECVQFGGPERTVLRTCEIPSRGVNWVAYRRGLKPAFASTKALSPATQAVALNWRILIFPQPANFFAKSRLESRIQCVAF